MTGIASRRYLGRLGCEETQNWQLFIDPIRNLSQWLQLLDKSLQTFCKQRAKGCNTVFAVVFCCCIADCILYYYLSSSTSPSSIQNKTRQKPKNKQFILSRTGTTFVPLRTKQSCKHRLERSWSFGQHSPSTILEDPLRPISV